MHDWRNFNNKSFESIMIILCDNSMTTVIHPTTWAQHTFVQDSVFIGTHIMYNEELFYI